MAMLPVLLVGPAVGVAGTVASSIISGAAVAATAAGLFYAKKHASDDQVRAVAQDRPHARVPGSACECQQILEESTNLLDAQRLRELAHKFSGKGDILTDSPCRVLGSGGIFGILFPVVRATHPMNDVAQQVMSREAEVRVQTTLVNASKIIRTSEECAFSIFHFEPDSNATDEDMEVFRCMIESWFMSLRKSLGEDSGAIEVRVYRGSWKVVVCILGVALIVSVSAALAYGFAHGGMAAPALFCCSCFLQ